jgi:hypothetical protein
VGTWAGTEQALGRKGREEIQLKPSGQPAGTKRGGGGSGL